jgi:hypothetical protein
MLYRVLYAAACALCTAIVGSATVQGLSRATLASHRLPRVYYPAAARYTGTHGSRTRGSQAWRVATGQYTRLLLLAWVRDGSSKMLSLAQFELSKRLFLCPSRLLLSV